ncbi:MAG: hypothetical protein H8D80_00280 [Proteobacteria bacterium]|nr:hypothetical protein [Pseudomonadota bacterium]
MILIDNNQILIASIFQAIKYSDISDESLIRHMVLNSYRIYLNKFKNKYGEVVICHDSPDCWRKKEFPYYKINRKKSKDKSQHDWNAIFDCILKIKKEVELVFPWKNVSVQNTEADDIIAILTKHYHSTEPIVIVSNDKDFQQLQRYKNVKQYSPLKKSFIKCEDPEYYLMEHIIKGDSSDGIPNILSDDDVFFDENKRQKPCGVKKASKIIENLNEWNNTEKWKRNQTLVDFNKIPDDIEHNIIEAYTSCVPSDGKIYDYFIKNKLVKLLENIEEFY